MQSTGDPCIYVGSGDEMIIAVQMDNIVIARKRVEKFKRGLGKRFSVKDIGKLHYFLGIRIVQDNSTGEVQPAYVWNGGCKVCGATPCDAGNKLVKAEDRIDQGMYQSAVASLMYLATGTRPDMACRK